jgi:hypothetical protein
LGLGHAFELCQTNNRQGESPQSVELNIVEPCSLSSNKSLCVDANLAKKQIVECFDRALKRVCDLDAHEHAAYLKVGRLLRALKRSWLYDTRCPIEVDSSVVLERQHDTVQFGTLISLRQYSRLDRPNIVVGVRAESEMSKCCK